MYCKNCGADLPEGTVFCGNCGMRTGAEEANQEPQGGAPETGAYTEKEAYTEPNCQYRYQNNAAPVAPQGKSSNPTLWIVLSAVETILCCQFIPGIIGLVFAIMASSAKSEGDFDKASRYCKYSMIAVIVGVVLAVIFFVGMFFLSIAAGVETAKEIAPYIEQNIQDGYQYFDPSQYAYY